MIGCLIVLYNVVQFNWLLQFECTPLSEYWRPCPCHKFDTWRACQTRVSSVSGSCFHNGAYTCVHLLCCYCPLKSCWNWHEISAVLLLFGNMWWTMSRSGISRTFNLTLLPSMRSLWSSLGPYQTLNRHLFNCSSFFEPEMLSCTFGVSSSQWLELSAPKSWGNSVNYEMDLN